MTVPLRVLAVDDERPALQDLARLLDAHPDIGRVECASSGAEALQRLAGGPFDAVFLDVRMPGLDGVELARVLRNFAEPPCLVFVSAYESAAVEAFELRALDYLVKPVSRTRMAEAVARIVEDRGTRANGGVTASAPATTRADASLDADVISVDTVRGGGTRLLPRSSILYVEAHGDYVRIVADEGRFLLRASLGEIERRWQPLGFVRVHRSYVVNLRRAKEIRPQLDGSVVVVLADRSEVPVARRQVADLRRRLRA
jgi:DNA-binding LytR/AlgR family response regulator